MTSMATGRVSVTVLATGHTLYGSESNANGGSIVYLPNVPATVAIERMWLYGRRGATGATVDELTTLQNRLMTGQTITYVAYDQSAEIIGSTRLVPENYPVTHVTEYTF